MSQVGSWMQTMAVGWLSLQLSDSAFVVGVVASVGAIPIVLFSMHAGAFVDHGDKLRLVRVTQSILLALWLVTITGVVSIPILLGLAFVQGLCSAVEIPARQSMIIQLVGRDDLQPAIALNSSGFNLARVIGPAIGGLVIARFGIAWCFGLNALSFVAVLWGLLRIKLPVPAMTNNVRLSVTGVHELLERSSAGAAEGLRHLAKPGPVRDLLALVTMGAVLGGPFLTIMPVIARDQLGLGAGGYGTLLATVGVGGLLGALLVAGPISHAANKGRVLMTAGLAFPTLLLGFAYTTTLAMAYVLLFATGLAMITFNALSNGVLQLLVEEKYRGRLMAFYSLVFVGLSQAVGSFAMGALARVVTAPHAIAISAVLLMLASLYALRFSDFWRRV